MDRNLGAYIKGPVDKSGYQRVAGFYYQWGRKDPFPSGASYNSTALTPTFDKEGKPINQLASPYAVPVSSSWTNTYQSIAYTVNNPGVLIVADKFSDWIYGTSDGSANQKASQKLWGAPSSSSTSLPIDQPFIGKTIYDPCPTGFTVAPPDIWSNFSTTNGWRLLDFATINTPDAKSAVSPNDEYYGRHFYINGTSGETAWYPATNVLAGGKYVVSSNPVIRINARESGTSAHGFYAILHAAGISLLESAGGNSQAIAVRCVREEDALANKHLEPAP
mgnify:FL=1